VTSSWSRAWGESWGLSWGLTYEANQDDLYAIDPIHGPGIYREDSPKSSRDFDFLDPEYHKRRIAPKVKKIIAKVAKQATKVDQKATPNAQKQPEASEYVDSLIALLERENVAFKRFYADLLEQQIEAQRLAQIRLQLELLGIYEQIQEEDEQAIMLLMLEL
jgi:hypothetical protein